MSVHNIVINPQIDQSLELSQTDSQTSSMIRSCISKTSECSTQVNMDKQFPQGELAKERKKNKKKQYKRRKRQKVKEEERSAKMRLASLIDLIYQREINFQKCQCEVRSCLETLVEGDKFHSFLNQAIRIQINNIQKEIWDYMQTIIQENPLQRFDDDQNFYIKMVDKIYQQYKKLKYSSRQIQQIINCYMIMTESSKDNITQCQNLDISTFNYLIESDESIKNLIHICQRRISIRHKVQIQRLKQIADIMNTEEEEDDEDYYEQEYEEITEKSTSVEEQEQQMKKGKKKRKKKNKQTEYSNNTEDVLARLNQMIIIDEARINCKADQSWISKLASKYSVQI